MVNCIQSKLVVLTSLLTIPSLVRVFFTVFRTDARLKVCCDLNDRIRSGMLDVSAKHAFSNRAFDVAKEVCCQWGPEF